MSPRTQEQFEEIRENRRKQIMDAALELFAKEGFTHCSIAQLAQHAGISKGLMYNYFESKEALLIAMIEEGINDLLTWADPDKDGTITPVELENLIRQTFSSILENLDFWVLYISVVLQPRVREFLAGKPFSNILERFGPLLLEYFISQGFEDPYLEMVTFSAMLEGLGVLLVYVYPGEELPEEMIRKFENRMIEMFIKKPS